MFPRDPRFDDLPRVAGGWVGAERFEASIQFSTLCLGHLDRVGDARDAVPDLFDELKSLCGTELEDVGDRNLLRHVWDSMVGR